MGIKLRRVAATITACVGAAVVSVGVALISLPAGIIVAGGCLLALGLLADWGEQ